MDESQKTQLLDEVTQLRERVQSLEADLTTARSIRNQAIMRALKAGVRQVDLVVAAGLTRDAIYKISQGYR